MTIAFRPIRPDDHPAMLALCALIWSGHDYIPDVWDDWLKDPNGQFTAVIDLQAGERLIGLGKLTLVTAPQLPGEPGEWWLEGLRLDPAYQGRGIGSQMHEYNVGLWRRGGPGALRLVTDSNNRPVHHLCERTGFRLIADVTVFEAESTVADPPTAFRPLSPSEVDSAFSLVGRDHLYQTFQHLFCLEGVWKWAELTPQRLARCAERGQAWRWRESHGLILGTLEPQGESPLDGRPCLLVCFAGAARDSLPDLLRDLRLLAGSLGAPWVGLPAPLGDPFTQKALAQAGYGRAWTGSLYLYEARQ